MDQNFEKVCSTQAGAERRDDTGSETGSHPCPDGGGTGRQGAGGRMPLPACRLSTLPVQAVLRGEEVSMGGTVVKNDQGLSNLLIGGWRWP